MDIQTALKIVQAVCDACPLSKNDRANTEHALQTIYGVLDASLRAKRESASDESGISKES